VFIIAELFEQRLQAATAQAHYETYGYSDPQREAMMAFAITAPLAQIRLAGPAAAAVNAGSRVLLEAGKQGKHIPGHNNFIPGRSPLTHNSPQSLLDNFAGKGQPVGNVPRGSPGFKERVDFGQVIGEINGQPTTKGIIHYSKDGAHIVPANP